MAKSTTLTIDVENPKKSYSLSGIQKIVLTNSTDYWGTGYLPSIISDVSFSGKNMTLTLDGYEKKLNFTGVTSLDNISVEYNHAGEDIINDAGELTNTLNAILAANPITSPQKGTTVTGSILKDKIDLTTFRLKDKKTNEDITDTTKKGLTIDGGIGNDSITGSIYADTIKAGDGNDVITGSTGADKVTGGTGQNTYKYTAAENMKGDQVILTKGERATIDVSGVAGEVTYKVNGKDLDVKIGDNTLKVMGFGAKDITNNSTKKSPLDTSEVILKTAGGNINLRTDLLSQTEISKNFTGTYLRDNVTAENYENAKEKGLTINTGLGADSIVGSKYADVIKGGDGADSITGGWGNDALYGEGGNNTFIFNSGDGNDIVYSGKGDDNLKFNSIQLQNITMLQGTGKNNKDLIIKYTNDDTVTVKDYYTVNKKGVITGINPKNTVNTITTNEGTFNISDYALSYKFAWGTGFASHEHTTITMNPDSVVNNIMFNANASIGNLKFLREGDDLRIWYNNDSTLDLSGLGDSGNVYTYQGSELYKKSDSAAYCSSITIKDYFAVENQTIDNVILKYDDTWTHTITEFSIQSDSDRMTGYSNSVSLNADSISAGTYENNVYTGTKFADVIYANSGTGDGDTIHGGAGNDLLYTWGRSDSAYGDTGNDEILGNTACLVLDGGAGDDTITLKNSSGENPQGYVKIVGGTGNDTISGYAGAKKTVFEFNKGDGVDIVTSTSELDELKFNDVALSELTVTQSGNDAVITYGESDSIRIKNAVSDLITVGITDKNGAETSVLEQLHIIKGAGAFSGTDNAETIYGSTGADTITSGQGNDVLYAKAGDDVLVFNNGDGADTVQQGVNGDTDTLKFADSELDDLDFTVTNTNDLTITYNGGEDSVTVKDYFVAGNTVTQWADSNGDIYSLATVNRHAIDSTAETINGTVFNDVITVNAENTDINGAEGANTYLLSQDGTFNITSTSGRDTIKFTEDALASLTYSVSDDDVVIKNDDEGITVNVKDYLVNMPAIYIQGATGDPANLISQLADAGFIYSDAATINGNAGVADRIYAGDSANVIDGKGGGDIINAGLGDDTMKFATGYGASTVINGTQEGEVDTLQFVDSQLDDLDYEIDEEDLIIRYNDGEDSVTVKDYYTAGNTVTNLITRNSEDTGDEEHLMSDIRHVIHASTTTIEGTELNDKIYGTAGDDTFETSVGSDILIGGDGADTYKFRCGSGFADRQHSVVVMGTDGVADTIALTNTAGNFGNMAFTKEGDDLRIWYNPDASLDIPSGLSVYQGSEVYKGGPFTQKFCSSVTVKDYFTADQTIDTITTNNGAYVYSILNDSRGGNDSRGFIYSADLGYYDAEGRLDTYEDNVYTGTKYTDQVYMRTGSGEGDTVYAGAGNDYVYSWGRADTIYGQDGKDIIIGTYKSLLLDGGAGNDEIHISGSGQGANTQGYLLVYGGAGSDDISVTYSKDSPVYAYTNSAEGGKDTTAGITDKIDLQWFYGNNRIYAQSRVNNLYGGSGNESYFAYIDQRTNITEKGGTDTLTLTNTDETTDGAKANLHVLFNVTADYDYDDTDASTLFNSKVLITDNATKANYNVWKSSGAFTGISIGGNAVETIQSSDGYTLTNAQISELAETVAGWLTTNTFADVNTVFASGTDDQIEDLIAVFDGAGWQAPVA